MFPAVFQALQASPAVVAIVADKVYRHGAVPTGTSAPYVTWQLIVGTPIQTLSELPSVDRATVQVDCWHLDDEVIEVLAKAVRDAIEPLACLTSMPIDGQEPDTKLFRFGLQFDWFVGRSA